MICETFLLDGYGALIHDDLESSDQNRYNMVTCGSSNKTWHHEIHSMFIQADEPLSMSLVCLYNIVSSHVWFC